MFNCAPANLQDALRSAFVLPCALRRHRDDPDRGERVRLADGEAEAVPCLRAAVADRSCDSTLSKIRVG
jgi:hypothetical protein